MKLWNVKNVNTAKETTAHYAYTPKENVTTAATFVWQMIIANLKEHEKMTEMRQIKVTEDVKTQLDNLKYDKETYNLVIQRLIRENSDLRLEKERLYKILNNLSQK